MCVALMLPDAGGFGLFVGNVQSFPFNILANPKEGRFCALLGVRMGPGLGTAGS